MKNISFKKYLIPFSHIVFWFVSFNFWTTILNPGLESPTSFAGIEVDWNIILLVNVSLLIYSAFPFIWLVRRKRLVWLKLLLTVAYAAPLIYVAITGNQSDGKENTISVMVDYYVRNFLYLVVFHLPIAFAVYFNLNYLIKKYLNQNRFVAYIGLILATCFISAIVGYAQFDYLLDKIFPDLFYISFFKPEELFLITVAYLFFTTFAYFIWQYAKMLVERKEAAQNELAALKAQINPHFLFNNLNTIYSMAAQNDQRATDVILKLSDFLRYVLYDTAAERIPLAKEVEMIKTYVGLQKERINQDIIEISLEASGDFSGVEIAPLLLLPLAENCFKHGVGKDCGYIKISINYTNGQLVFETENTIALREKATDKNHGIGILNIEKRLSLIYPDRHSLKYQANDGIFKVEMKLQLDA